ncbi:TetR/AcrR family transcriptional regulator [Anaerocolumna sp. AGMB13020]|uniref:TetR/AcrR family transcriptional regulator n=1 Tax=Anaerocolumna sp. AGMB13020 TaxID=3081750 RepID=UPI002955BB13|nr:TetR/AcrR family transcriptional regulator [Anaerocolumna sp. AGMB13020]WOO37103.1 TetR/AcrR family transcriptional regulator [Anaerocolumna sp. AGMB13020]
MGRSKEFEENAVLQKAMEVFWKQGYEKTSMSDLVEQMGIHRKSLYDTFGDKHSLYLKVMDRYGEFSTDRLKSEIFRADTAYQAIQYIFDYIIEANDEKHCGCLFVNAATEMGPWDQEVVKKSEEAFSEAENYITEILKKGRENGELFYKYDDEVLGEVLHNALLGLRVLVKTSASKEKMHNIANFFLELICV